MKASVKVMNSYDFGHFEICLSSDEDLNIGTIDEMRKQAQRLVDKAIHQYKVAKKNADKMIYGSERSLLERDVKIIKENYPKSEWTVQQKAKVKALEDFEYYDYQEGWDIGDQSY